MLAVQYPIAVPYREGSGAWRRGLFGHFALARPDSLKHTVERLALGFSREIGLLDLRFREFGARLTMMRHLGRAHA